MASPIPLALHMYTVMSHVPCMQLYSLAQMEGKWVSCSSLDRRISALFFTWVSVPPTPMRHLHISAPRMSARQGPLPVCSSCRGFATHCLS